MASKQLRDTFTTMTNNLDKIMANGKVYNFMNYCSEVVEGLEDVDVSMQDIEDVELLRDMSNVALEQMLAEAERMQLTDEELLAGMLIMAGREARNDALNN